MANPVGDERALLDAAQQLRRCADRIETVYGTTDRGLRGVTWIGRRSSRMAGRVSGRERLATATAGDLRAVAVQLDGHADWVRRTIRELEGIESSVRTWASANPAGSSPTGVDASLVDSWPAYCSFEWRGLRKRLRGAGAPV